MAVRRCDQWHAALKQITKICGYAKAFIIRNNHKNHENVANCQNSTNSQSFRFPINRQLNLTIALSESGIIGIATY
jgi:hypothetical protein